MKRSTVFDESHAGSAAWLLWFMVMLGAVVGVLALATAAGGGTAHYSLEGWFSQGGETQSFLFDLGYSVPSSETFSLRTWHYAGGGFDPILHLYGGESLAARDNDINRTSSNLDAELTWGSATYRPEEVALRDPVRSGAYRLDLKAVGGSLGGRGPNWAVDLVAPADKITLTGLAYDGNTNIKSVAIGSSDLSSPAKIAIGSGQALSMSGHFVAGNTGRGDIELFYGALASGDSWLGYGSGSLGIVTLYNYSQWSADTVQLGRLGDAGLLVASHSEAEFFGDALIAYYSTSGSTVTVTGTDSMLTVHGDLEVGDGGDGGLHIADHGQVDSRDAGTLGRDVVADDATATGIVTVVGENALWQTDKLIVGNYGQGMVDIRDGGKIATTGNAYIGYSTAADNSRVNLTGAAPGGAPSTWQVSGNLYIAGNETGPSNALQSHLTINPGGVVDVAGTTTYWESGGWLELHGGTLRTGALVKGCGLFNWTSGTLELTNSGLTLDSSTPNSVFAHDVTIGAGRWLRLSSPHAGDKLIIGDSAAGALRVEGGGAVTSKSVVHLAADEHFSTGVLTVTGAGSSFTAQAPMFIGAEGTGTMNIELGGRIQVTGDVKVGPAAGIGRVEVRGATSRWDITGSIEVGQGYLNIFDQAVVTSGNATISGGAGLTSGHALVDGFTVGIGTPARWDVSGNMSIVNDTSGLSVMRNGRVKVTGDIVLGPTGPGSSGTTLSVQSSGHVDIDGTLRVGAMANLALSGSGSIHTRSLIVEPTGRLKHDDGSLTVDGGAFIMDAGQLVIDSATGAPNLRLQNGGQGSVPVPAFGTGILAVGKNDRGRLEILSGARLTSSTGWISSWGPIQQGPGGGHVLVQGTGSLWRVTADNGGGPGTGWADPFRIAHNQQGTLEIRDGGQVIVTGPVFIHGSPRAGGSQGGPGTAIVDGPNSLLRATTDLSGMVAASGQIDIGTAGTSTEDYSFLTVSNGGRVDVDNRIRVKNTGAITLTSDGEIRAGSFIVEGGTFTHEDGTLTVDGGTLNPGVGGAIYRIDGPDAGSMPVVVLKNGADLELTNTLLVGDDYAGKLSIESGAVVTSLNGRIGSAVGTSDGRVIVNGAGSKWTNTADLEVGVRNIGLMEVQDHGRVENTIGSIAPAPGSQGTVNVSSSGVWYNSGALYIGGKFTAGGVGELNVRVGGSVITNEHLKVWPHGAVNVDGELTAQFVGNDGRVAGSGAVQLAAGHAFGNNGVVAPGTSAGFLSINGDYVQSINGWLEVQLGGTAAGQYDALFVDGGVWLDGGLEVSLLPGYSPSANDTFEIITATGSVVPAFIDHVLPQLTGGRTWGLSYNPASVVLSVLGPSNLTGDYNQNGAVDAADYVVWRDNVGANLTLPNEDPSQTPGWVTNEDYIVWRAHFGQAAASSTGSLLASRSQPPASCGAIPEPATVWFIGWEILSLSIQRRSTRRNALSRRSLHTWRI